MTRIAVLLHAQTSREQVPPWIALQMEEAWREAGHEVSILYGPDDTSEADLLVPNVDLTVLPRAYTDFYDRFEHVVNRDVVDISKRAFSKLRVKPGDGYEGPVIVKTNLNAGGMPEEKIHGKPARESKWRRMLYRRDRKTGFHPKLAIRPWKYPIFDSIRDVPAETFEDDYFHVEKFLPEREGEHWATRSYVCAGNHEFSIRNVADRPIVKANGIVDRQVVDVPEQMREIRRELSFDFGKFDYTEIDGEVHLFDVNRTPTFARNPKSKERHKRMTAEMAHGILERFKLA